MQRYKFESNSQLKSPPSKAISGCVYLCKDTNLKAIHNYRTESWQLHGVVFTYAKIQIWKQFTTDNRVCTHLLQLCLPMQRYKFESNSQQLSHGRNTLTRCVYLCKDTNLKAIHNATSSVRVLCKVVFTYAKIQIWKQFTTTSDQGATKGTLCLPMQRYKFESNSQLYYWFVLSWTRCVYLCKDTNLKAIHNLIWGTPSTNSVVFTYAKIQIWKQFTTVDFQVKSLFELCLPMQRYKFESNSQQTDVVTFCRTGCVYLCKDTNLKAIHNATNVTPVDILLCLPMQRYKFESNSQQRTRPHPCQQVVFTYAKIQIWKQFTTL